MCGRIFEKRCISLDNLVFLLWMTKKEKEKKNKIQLKHNLLNKYDMV